MKTATRNRSELWAGTRRRHPVWGRLAPLSVAIAVLGACGDDDAAAKVNTVTGCVRADDCDASARDLDAGDAEAPDNPCDGRRDGRICGEGLHCVRQECRRNFCGDGVVGGAEQCDDGNARLDDDCDPSCRRIEPPPEPPPPTPLCGDGNVDPGEACDDGDDVDDDSCSNDCTIPTTCGDGVREGDEECDDGNRDNDDYCSDECKRLLCRNGVLDPGEACDDGNAIDDDGCTNACEIVECGDGVVYTAAGPLAEECDDGNDVDDDGCSNACLLSECGNRRTDPGEVCDGNEGPEGGLCNDTCTAFEADLCMECTERECADFEGVDLFTPCRVEARSDNVLFPPPGDSFTELCTAFDRCLLDNRCFERQGVACTCGELTIEECSMLQNQTPPGPCAAEVAAATGCPPTDVLCIINSTQDLSLVSGYAVYLNTACRVARCAQECGVPATGGS